jgi:hypothetical protein
MSARGAERAGADPPRAEPVAPSPPRSSLPPWLQTQTVRLVVSGLTTVYFVGILFDLRGHLLAQAVEAFVLLVVGLVLLLTVRWWSPSGERATRPHSRVFLALAALALLIQGVVVVLQSANPNDLANNSASLLLLFVLVLNTQS